MWTRTWRCELGWWLRFGLFWQRGVCGGGGGLGDCSGAWFVCASITREMLWAPNDWCMKLTGVVVPCVCVGLHASRHVYSGLVFLW